jgi:L-serine dehydratase
MEIISIFDMLKIGIGPSSSHTLGPWKAGNSFIEELGQDLAKIDAIQIELFGSLSLTGKGHATDMAVVMGLLGHIPDKLDVNLIQNIINEVKTTGKLIIGTNKTVNFSFENDIIYHKTFLEFHPNAVTFSAFGKNIKRSETYYSIGGGFVIKKNEPNISHTAAIPWPIQNGLDLLSYTSKNKISDIVYQNELALNNAIFVDSQLEKIWLTMVESVFIGCTTTGVLPGGLNVKRRAKGIYENLNGPIANKNFDLWLEDLRALEVSFGEVLKWVSCFAMAVNEVNASMGRIVTAPTNGSAGVIPAVLLYYLMIENKDAGFNEIRQFLLVAGEIGSIFKKGATISAAMGGCQAEIGVSSAMAAAALCELLGGSPEQVLVAAEIAMEHHLGLTCDPIGGLVQLPCIERNSMGALKAITAANLALETNPKETKVPLDKVIATMWQTAKDMNNKYKETSTGGLAIAVNMADC